MEILQCNRKHRLVTSILNDATGTFQVTVSGVTEGTVTRSVPSTFFVHTGPGSNCAIEVGFTKDGNTLPQVSVEPASANSKPGTPHRIVKASPASSMTDEAQAVITPC